MNIQTFKENDQYKLFVDAFNYIVLSVSFVESNVVWLCAKDCGYQNYKYNLKTGKLYKWCNTGYDAVDMQHGFIPLECKLNSDEIWEERMHQTKQPSFYGD